MIVPGSSTRSSTFSGICHSPATTLDIFIYTSWRVHGTNQAYFSDLLGSGENKTVLRCREQSLLICQIVPHVWEILTTTNDPPTLLLLIPRLLCHASTALLSSSWRVVQKHKFRAIWVHKNRGFPFGFSFTPQTRGTTNKRHP